MRNERRSRRLAGTVAAALLAAATLLATATSAQAAIQLSETMVYDTEPVLVESLSIPPAAATATHITAAECDLDDPPGTACNEDTAVGFTEIGDFVADGVEVEVWDSFLNWDFVEQDDGVGSTECAETEGDEDCGIVVSYYYAPNYPFGGPIVQLAADVEEITFE